MVPKFVDGWVIVPYDGSDLTRCKIGLNDYWQPAFKDWYGEQRVLKVRPPKNQSRSVYTVWVDKNGQIKKVGSVRVVK